MTPTGFQRIMLIIVTFQSSEQAIESIPFHQGSRNLYKALGIKKEGYYLIRPDLYIAYRSNRLDPKQLEAYLKVFLDQ